MLSNNLALTASFLPYIIYKVMKTGSFHKYLKPTLKKLHAKDPDNWDKYINQVLASYHVTPHLATAETPFFLVCGNGSNLPLHQLLEPMQQFLSDPDSGHLDLKSHQPALARAKKTLDENRFKHVQQKCIPPNFKVGNRVFFKNKQPGKWDLRWRAGYRVVHIECNKHYLHIEKLDLAMSRMLYRNPQLSCGMLTQCLAQLENL